MLIRQRKYKDEYPKNTINKIRNILNQLGILTIETVWKNSAEGYYSVSIMIEGTNLFTNGKGTSHEYALASGYAELLERLQNLAHFRLGRDLSDRVLKYGGFFYAPDEKQVSIEEMMKSQEDWINIQLSKFNTKEEKEDILNKWKMVSYENTPSDFITLPYFNAKSKGISHIPLKMITKMYMSNGMCAGNTPQEALVQGLSEVLERAVNKAIIKEKITPPTIPDYYIDRFPRIREMINKIKLKGNYDVIIKDCSLGKNYPVVAAIFINKDNQSYFVKFGSHPIFEIAAERTLTELLQGQDVNNMMGMKEFSYLSKVKDGDKNLLGILVNGSGFYPTELFSSQFSYQFEEFKDLSELNNQQLLDYLVDYTANMGHEIFIRDVSFLGFPSFHTIVTGLSEVDEFEDIKSLDQFREYNNTKRTIRNIKSVSKEELSKAVDFLKSLNYTSEDSIAGLLNIPVKNIFPWYYVKMPLFVAAVHYKNRDYKEAYEVYDRFIEGLNPNLYDKLSISYYKCSRDFIGTKIDNLSQDKAMELLLSFYPQELVRGVVYDIGNPEEILIRYGQIDCFNCDRCDLKDHCLHQDIEDIYRKLKDAYGKNSIDQRELVKIL